MATSSGLPWGDLRDYRRQRGITVEQTTRVIEGRTLVRETVWRVAFPAESGNVLDPPTDLPPAEQCLRVLVGAEGCPWWLDLDPARGALPSDADRALIDRARACLSAGPPPRRPPLRRGPRPRRMRGTTPRETYEKCVEIVRLHDEEHLSFKQIGERVVDADGYGLAARTVRDYYHALLRGDAPPPVPAARPQSLRRYLKRSPFALSKRAGCNRRAPGDLGSASTTTQPDARRKLL